MRELQNVIICLVITSVTEYSGTKISSLEDKGNRVCDNQSGEIN